MADNIMSRSGADSRAGKSQNKEKQDNFANDRRRASEAGKQDSGQRT